MPTFLSNHTDNLSEKKSKKYVLSVNVFLNMKKFKKDDLLICNCSNCDQYCNAL